MMTFGTTKSFANRRKKSRRCGAAEQLVRQVLNHVKELVEARRDHDGPWRRQRKADRGTRSDAGLKGYYDYPCVLCTSVNEEICAWNPVGKTVLESGDIVSVDCGVVLDGYYGDAAIHRSGWRDFDGGIEKASRGHGSFAVQGH